MFLTSHLPNPRQSTARRFAVIASLLLWLCVPVHAAVVSTSGNIQFGAAPASVVDGSNENDTAMLLFAERSGVTLGAPLAFVPSALSLAMSLNASTPESPLAAGTRVDSYLVHADRTGAANALMFGTITFDTDILGVILRSASLNASDGELGAAGTSYGTGLTRGMEDPFDFLLVSPDLRSLSLWLDFSTADQVRIITAAATAPDINAVPLPAASWLMLPATLFMLIRGRRERART